MRWHSKVVEVSILALATTIAWGAEPGSPDTKKADSTVVMQVTVEQKGGSVPDLTARNFRVYEDRDPREVSRAEPAGPASIVLLVENSLHSWRFLNDARSAMRGFLKAAAEEKGHSYTLVTYEPKAVVEQSLTQQIDDIRTAFANVEQSVWGRTDTYDSIYRVVEEMESLPGRRVLLFIGVGYDVFSRRTFGELQRKVEAANIQVYGFASGSDLRRWPGHPAKTPERPDLRQGETLLRMLAEQSGGKWYCPTCEADYAESMRDTMETLDRQYTVEYRRPGQPEPGFRKLRVEAFELINDSRRDFKVHARPGWRVEDSPR
jgi:VWFA-related protein